MAIVCYNKQFYEDERVPIYYNNRAFKFGDSFSEQVRCNGHFPLNFDLHYKRILKAMVSYGFSISQLPSESDLISNINTLLYKNKIFKASVVVIQFFRTGSTQLSNISNGFNILMECTSLEFEQYTLNKKGLFVMDYTDCKKEYSPLSFCENGGAMYKVLASIECNKQYFDECLIYNGDNKILECINYNLFVIKDSKVYTSSVFSGCEAGIMRQYLIDLLKDSSGYDVIELDGLEPQDILGADEVFLTNTQNGIQWVVAYREKRFYNNKVRDICTLLNSKIFE